MPGKLKTCPACGRDHRTAAAAKKCMGKRVGKQSWTWKELGFENPNKKDEPKKEEKKEFDFEGAFNKLGDLLSNNQNNTRRYRKDKDE